MSKPRKAYRPKPVTLDPMRRALAQKCVLTPEERETVMREARPAFQRLRSGRADKQDWAYLADAANVGEALSELGICSDAPSRKMLTDMQLALKDLAERVNARGIWTAKGTELQAIEAGLLRHEIQLQFCSLQELRAAVANVERNVRAAKEGRMASVTIIEGVPA